MAKFNMAASILSPTSCNLQTFKISDDLSLYLPMGTPGKFESGRFSDYSNLSWFITRLSSLLDMPT